MAQTAKDTKDNEQQQGRRPVESPPEPETEAPGSSGHVCNVAFCPIGLALTAADRVQPEVVSHLLMAGREFFLAAKAVMDARAEDLDRDGDSDGPARMEHIDIG
jgi:hypothetical protein